MTTRQDLFQALTKASSLADQIKLVAELDALDNSRTAAVHAERSLDWADTTVRETLAPRIAYERDSASTDWLLDEPTGTPDYHQAVLADAATWYGRVHMAVKHDPEEFAEQAKGLARKVAGQYGQYGNAAAREFLDYVQFLYNRHLAASGLPQVQQLVDAFENPAQQALPQDVFDTFQPPVWEGNAGVDGMQQNSLAPGAEMAMSENGGAPAGDPSHHDWSGTDVQSAPGAGVIDGAPITAPSHAGPPGDPSEHEDNDYRTASVLGAPTVAIGYTGMNLNDFLVREAAGKLDDGVFAEDEDPSLNGQAPNAYGEQEAGRQMGGPDTGYQEYVRSKQGSRHPFGDATTREGVKHTAPGGGEHAPYRIEKVDGGYAVFNDKGERKNEKAKTKAQAREFQKALYKNVPGASESAKEDENKKEAASGLPQVQQEVDAFENPAPTSLPTDVMFPMDQPWPEETSAQYLQQGGQDTGSTHKPHSGARKQADMYGGGDAPHAVPGGETPVGNTPATTDQKPHGNYAVGFGEGQRDARSGERPTFTDASSAVSPYVKGYTEGFASVPAPQGATDTPYSMGGDSGQAMNASEVAARTERPELSIASRRIAKGDEGVSQKKRDTAESKGHTLPGTDKFPIDNKQDLENAKHDIGRTNEPHDKVVRYINERADDLDAPHVGEDSKTAMKVSAKILTKDVSRDDAFAEGYRVASHWNDRRGLPPVGSTGYEAGLYAGITDNPTQQRSWTAMHREAGLTDRLDAHQAITMSYLDRDPEALAKGIYVHSATSSDLDTMSPASTPDPFGATPLVGPGTVPPLRGAPGTPAASAGPSPYNGAEPLGTAVVEDPLIESRIPAVQPETGDTAPNMSGDSSLLRGNPATLAFRKRVQSNKLALRQSKEK
jgi:hypothetical protein